MYQKRILILKNPLAGVGRSVVLAAKLSVILNEKSIAHELSDQWPDDLSAFTDVWIVGGDGTLNYFVNKYPSLDIPLVIWKGGTGNDFHWLLYGDLSFEAQLEIALNGRTRPYDAGKCNDIYFMNGIGIGFEGAVAYAVQGKKKLPGKTSFMIAVLKKIFSYRSAGYEVKSEKSKVNDKRCLLVSIMNGSRAGGGFHVAPASAADDGLLDVVEVDDLPVLKRLRYLPVIEKGKHLQLPFIHHYKTDKIVLRSDTTVQAHADGEPFSANSFEIEILPKHFLFRVP